MDSLRDQLTALKELTDATTVWKPASLDDEPESRLTQWKVFLVKGNIKDLGDTIHFVGYAGYEGRVCSPIILYDKKSKRGVSHSGRIYELFGPSGSNADAMHVWHKWVRMLGHPEIVEVTKEYE